MRDEEINRRFEQADKDAKAYTDMKIRAVKKILAPFIWMRNHPWKTLLLLALFMIVTGTIYRMIDLKATIEKRFDIEIKD